MPHQMHEPKREVIIEPMPGPVATDRLRQDLDELAELLVLAVESGAAVSFLAPLSRSQACAWWEATLSTLHPRGVLLVARDPGDPEPGRIVGTALLQPAWAPNQPHRADVCKVIVHPNAQRRGIARRLMVAIEVAACQRGFTLLTLDAKAGGPADRLYRSIGWTYVGGIPDFALNSDAQAFHDNAIFYLRVPRG